MKKLNYEKVETVIGYNFNNLNLLKQAFFRSSFAHDNECESNEVLEFIGDKVLDLAVIRILLEKYAKYDKNGGYLKSSKKEGELTKIKSELVSTGYLAASFEMLYIDEFICYGKSDLNNKATDNMSVKEDVFEAIIGAIAIDSNWNMDKIIKIVKRLLHIDEYLKQSEVDTNYTGQLQELLSSLGWPAPTYTLDVVRKNDSSMWRAICAIKGLNNATKGYGYKQKDAKKDAAKKMIEKVNSYLDEDGEEEQSKEVDVFAKFNSYVQAGYIEKPEYEFNESYDEDGNPYWECIFDIYELNRRFYGYGSSKKEAQKYAIAKALKHLK